MQDPSSYSVQMNPVQFPEQEHLKCPRCDSDNTKFCYYNNYNLSQPRHFCKNCKRYWTKGGTLRNIPVGGATRKISKRSSSNSKPSPTSPSPPSPSPAPPPTVSSLSVPFEPKPEPSGDRDSRLVDLGGNLSSLLTSGGQFRDFTVHPSMDSMRVGYGFMENRNLDESGPMIQNPRMEIRTNNSKNDSERCLGVETGDVSGYWNGGNGWPGLSIYPPGSDFL